MTLRMKDRQRVLKAMLATVLNLDLRPSDLRELRNELAHGNLANELGYLIDTLSDHFQRYESTRSTIQDGNSLVEDFQEFVQRKRLSKAQVSSIIRSIMGPAFASNLGTNKTLREMVEALVLSMDQEEARTLETLIRDEDGDPYLRGILDR